MPDPIQQARDSLSRCIQSPEFLDLFYQLFMNSSEDIRKKFEKTDFDRQKKMLQDSLFVMLVAWRESLQEGIELMKSRY